MLYNVNRKEILVVSHKETYLCFNKLTDEEKEKINDRLQEIINAASLKEKGKQILISSFLPWTETVFQPVYEKATNCDKRLSAMIFGLVLMKNIIDNEKEWVIKKCKINGIMRTCYCLED